MTKNIQTLQGVLTSGSHGRRFTDAEEAIIVSTMTNAKKAGSTVSVAEIKNALKDFNQNAGHEARTRAAVVNAISRLAKAGKVEEAVLSKETNGREPYTEAEDAVIVDFLTGAQKAGKQVTLPEVHKALADSGKSPKPRSLPSVRAHIQNLLKVEETEGEAKAEDVG